MWCDPDHVKMLVTYHGKVGLGTSPENRNLWLSFRVASD